MMSLTSRIIILIVGFVILFVISYLVRRRKIFNLYAITWLGLSFIFILLGIFQRLTDFFARLLGIGLAPFAIIVIALGCILTIILHLSIIVSKQQNEINRLEKEIALLKVIYPSGKKKINHNKNK